jgi:hypothetical protein
VIFVAQDRMRAELKLRTEAGWKPSVLDRPGTELVVPSIGFRCFLSELYEGTPLRPRQT